MDIVGALNFYRTSVVDDPAKFEILHFLYKDGTAVEEELEALTGLDRRALKAVVREMYQANLVKTKGAKGFTLTELAEETLARLGADTTVAHFLIDDVIDASSAPGFHAFLSWSHHIEPDRAKSKVRSLRNLRDYVAHNKMLSEETRHSLVLWCLSPPDVSRSHVTLKNVMKNGAKKAGRPFTRSDDYGIQHGELMLPILNEYSESLSLCGRCDEMLWEAFEPSSKEPAAKKDVLAGLSFRVLNYLSGDASDFVLESAASGGESCNTRIWDAIWMDLNPIIEIVISSASDEAGPVRDKYEVRTSNDLCKAVIDTVNLRTGRHITEGRRKALAARLVLAMAPDGQYWRETPSVLGDESWGDAPERKPIADFKRP